MDVNWNWNNYSNNNKYKLLIDKYIYIIIKT